MHLGGYLAIKIDQCCSKLISFMIHSELGLHFMIAGPHLHCFELIGSEPMHIGSMPEPIGFLLMPIDSILEPIDFVT